MNIFDVIQKWDLSKANIDFNKYTRSAISNLAYEIQNLYNQPPNTYILKNRIHRTVSDSVRIIESENSIIDLTYPLILSQEIWLPDPLFSILSPEANSLWQKIPESGAIGFSDTPMIRTGWGNYWSTKISDRIKYLNLTVPQLVSNLQKIKSLVEAGYITIYPWEKIIKNQLSDMKTTIMTLKARKEIEKTLTQKYLQKDYSLGVRLGPLGITASSDFGDLKKGDPLWIGDKTEIYFVGIINAIITSFLNSNMYEGLPGDRIVHDYIRSNGNVLSENNFPKIVKEIPDFKNATWENIVEIKKDSELVNSLAVIISEFAYGDDKDLNQNLKDQLFEIAEKMKEQKNLLKYLPGQFISLSIGTLGGVATNVITGMDLNSSMILGASVASSSSLLRTIISDYFKPKNIASRKRKDIILKIARNI